MDRWFWPTPVTNVVSLHNSGYCRMNRTRTSVSGDCTWIIVAPEADASRSWSTILMSVSSWLLRRWFIFLWVAKHCMAYDITRCYFVKRLAKWQQFCIQSGFLSDWISAMPSMITTFTDFASPGRIIRLSISVRDIWSCLAGLYRPRSNEMTVFLPEPVTFALFCWACISTVNTHWQGQQLVCRRDLCLLHLGAD